MITFIGTGLLGSGFVKALLKKGEQVQVWNRTASKAKLLEADGAQAVDNIIDAVKGASRIHITLKDDAAVDEALAQASEGFEPGVIIIDHTTTSAPGAAERAEYWKKKGFTYLHAPVLMGPQNALDSTGFMMISGDQKVISELTPELEKMTGTLLNFGADTNKAAGMKLMTNLFFQAMTAGIIDVLSFAKSLGISKEEVNHLFDTVKPGGMAPYVVKKITSNTFETSTFELKMARKDVKLMMEQAMQTNSNLMVIPLVAARMDSLIDKGFGEHDWTVIAKDIVE